MLKLPLVRVRAPGDGHERKLGGNPSDDGKEQKTIQPRSLQVQNEKVKGEGRKELDGLHPAATGLNTASRSARWVGERLQKETVIGADQDIHLLAALMSPYNKDIC